MRIVVCGLGHVGSVVAACLLQQGHDVVGFDTDERARDLMAGGCPPFQEPGVADLISTGHAARRFSVTTNIRDEANADIIVVCVGSPGLANGALDLSDVKAAAHGVGEAIRLRASDRPPILLVFRSTMLPGSMTKTVLPAIIAAAGEAPGQRYEVSYNPEFVREGSAIADYLAPARIVIGERLPGTARKLLDLYAGIDAPVFTTSFEVAELTKFVDNAFHALKVAFANEIGRYALRSEIRPSEVFDLFLADSKLNLSSHYLRPGGAFGGPCLPKDIRALAAHRREIGIGATVIGHILESNTSHTEFLVAEINRRVASPLRILLVGLSFKAGTDDLRGSPLVDLAESLLDCGHDLAIYDPDLANCVAVHRDECPDVQLSSPLSAIMLSQLPSNVVWDLVVIGKTCPGIAEAVDGRSPVFLIDRI
jgi:GDP-mannose 6-dehydrogenase